MQERKQKEEQKQVRRKKKETEGIEIIHKNKGANEGGKRGWHVKSPMVIEKTHTHNI